MDGRPRKEPSICSEARDTKISQVKIAHRDTTTPKSYSFRSVKQIGSQNILYLCFCNGEIVQCFITISLMQVLMSRLAKWTVFKAGAVRLRICQAAVRHEHMKHETG
jgi:hypothetical protein